MGYTTTNRGLLATGTSGLVVGQGLGRGNTTIPLRGDYSIGLGVRSTTAAGLAASLVAIGSITVPEVIDDCMSMQRTDSSKDENEPPATHGTRSLTSKSLTKFHTSVKKSAMDNCFTFGSTEKDDNVKILQSCNGLLLAIYWNDALHWLKTENMQLTHYRLNIEDHEYPIITTIQIPQREMNFLESYVYMDPMLILIQIPYLLHLEGKLFESRRCLLLVCRDDIGSSEFTIYEMMKGCSVCSVRYHVDTDDFMTPLPKGWSIRSNQLDDNHDDELLQQFEAEHNVYEFIPSFASGRDLGLPLEAFFSSQLELELQVSSELDFKGLLGFGSEESVLEELMEIVGSTELHKRIRFWFMQEIAEEEGFLKFLRDRCDDLRRRCARLRVLIGEMEALGTRGVAIDCLDCLKQTQARETNKFTALT
ncbi:hypothetical protein Tco_1253020 [Tanacetum coccineum]